MNILWNVTIDQSFYLLVTACLHFVTNGYKFLGNIYEYL